jgi:pyridoxal phosphate enzyme (YggS family)
VSITDNIAYLNERITRASRQVGRNSEEITLMAVTKTVSPDRIRDAYDAGLRLFGENRVQEFAGKCGPLHDLAGAEWHMIGHLQTNKAAKAADLFSGIDSVDSLRLASRLNASAAELGKTIPVLIEINIGGEPAKTGLSPGSEELENLLDAASQMTSLQFRGLMALPPYHDDPEQSRPYFRKMRELFERIIDRKLPAIRFAVLSIGMSHDFEVGIEEGSTCVRIGTAVFGERPVLRSKV